MSSSETTETTAMSRSPSPSASASAPDRTSPATGRSIDDPNVRSPSFRTIDTVPSAVHRHHVDERVVVEVTRQQAGRALAHRHRFPQLELAVFVGDDGHGIRSFGQGRQVVEVVLPVLQVCRLHVDRERDEDRKEQLDRGLEFARSVVVEDDNGADFNVIVGHPRRHREVDGAVAIEVPALDVDGPFAAVDFLSERERAVAVPEQDVDVLE